MARKVVDELVVTLGLDMTGWNTGMAKAKTDMASLEKAARASMRAVVEAAGGEAGAIAAVAARARAAMTSAAKKADKALEGAGASGDAAGNKISNGMRRGTLGALSLLYAVTRLNKAFGIPMLLRWSEEVVESETKTLRLANALKLNTTALQQWQIVMGRHGVEADAFNGSLERIAGNIGKLGTQVRGAKILQQYLGLSGITDEMVKGKDSLSFLQLYVDQMGKMTAERQFTVGRRLGLTNEEIEAIKEAGPALREQLSAAKSLAATQDELEKARDVAIAQKELSQQWERAKQLIVTGLLPVLQGLVRALTGLAEFAQKHATFVRTVVIVAVLALTAALVSLAASFLGTIFPISAATVSLQAFSGAALAAQGSAGLLASGLGLVAIAGIASIATITNLIGQIDELEAKSRKLHQEASGFNAAAMGDPQQKGARFKSYEARHMSLMSYQTFKEQNEARLRSLQAARAEEASALSMSGAATREAHADKLAAIDQQVKELQTRLSLGATHFSQFMNIVRQQDSAADYAKLSRMAQAEGLMGNSTKIDTVNINVNSTKEATDVVRDLPHKALPLSSSFAGGMSGY